MQPILKNGRKNALWRHRKEGGRSVMPSASCLARKLGGRNRLFRPIMGPIIVKHACNGAAELLMNDPTIVRQQTADSRPDHRHPRTFPVSPRFPHNHPCFLPANGSCNVHQDSSCRNSQWNSHSLELWDRWWERYLGLDVRASHGCSKG